MRNLLFKIFSIIVAAMTATGCSHGYDAPEVTEVQRAVLVYMVANNSLGAAGFDAADLNEMVIAAQQGDFGDSRLFVYHHGRNYAPALLEITPEGEHTVIGYNTTQSSVSSSRMDRVISDFMRQAPAQRYGLILWSHGSGWIENGIEQPATLTAEAGNGGVSALSFGDDGGRYMNVTTLSGILRDRGFDYIYFDCCYMAGVEIAYELRHCADHIVASSTELPSNGMPYDETLRHLLKPDADLVAAARTTFDSYNALQGMNRTCTISVIDTDALDALADATRAVYSANNVNSEGFTPQQFMTSSCYIFDFGQYVDDLAAPFPALKADFDNALDAAVVYKASTPRLWNTLQLTHHSGLSTYLPGYSTTARYNYDNLQWAADVASALERQ